MDYGDRLMDENLLVIDRRIRCVGSVVEDTFNACFAVRLAPYLTSRGALVTGTRVSRMCRGPTKVGRLRGGCVHAAGLPCRPQPACPRTRRVAGRFGVSALHTRPREPRIFPDSHKDAAMNSISPKTPGMARRCTVAALAVAIAIGMGPPAAYAATLAVSSAAAVQRSWPTAPGRTRCTWPLRAASAMAPVRPRC